MAFGASRLVLNGQMINSIKNRVVPAIFSKIPSRVLGLVVGIHPLVAYYHMVSDDAVPHVRHLYRFRSVEAFGKDIETFLRTHRVIGLMDLIGALRGGRSLPKDALLITFDDGFREMYDIVAPILTAKGVTATFFLTTSYLDNLGMAHHNKVSLLVDRIEHDGGEWDHHRIREMLTDHSSWYGDIKTSLLRLDHTRSDVVDAVAGLVELNVDEFLCRQKPYLTSEQVQTLIGQGFSIGAHSIDHPLYALISSEEQLCQTRMSVRWIKERYSLQYGAFAFPHGASQVSAKIIDEIFADGELDVSFGTAGILRDAHPRHFERFSMENTADPVERIMARQFARSIYRAVLGQQIVGRP